MMLSRLIACTINEVQLRLSNAGCVGWNRERTFLISPMLSLQHSVATVDSRAASVGGRFVVPWLETCLPTPSACLSSSADLTAPERELFKFKLLLVDTPRDAILPRSRFSSCVVWWLLIPCSVISSRRLFRCSADSDAEWRLLNTTSSGENKRISESSSRTTKSSRQKWQVSRPCFKRRRSLHHPLLSPRRSSKTSRQRLIRWRRRFPSSKSSWRVRKRLSKSSKKRCKSSRKVLSRKRSACKRRLSTK
mmetsp:Transcript_47606/g.70856  ORF Transcript_47606/g.70856 Transcript_47606/m.70856 type:complete len:249 (-) Transcript_47606:1925-2671(-)